MNAGRQGLFGMSSERIPSETRPSESTPSERTRSERTPSAELILLGQKALAAVASVVAKGGQLAECQLVASLFYEALRKELRVTSPADLARRKMLTAALDQCQRTAVPGTASGVMLHELGSAVDMLPPDKPILTLVTTLPDNLPAILANPPPEPQPPRPRPTLRVIEGGLSRD